MEPMEDGFAHGIQQMIIPSMGDPNHPIMYHECATTAEDPGHIIQQVVARHLPSIVEVSNIPTNSPCNMKFRILLESMEPISETQDSLLF
jgi:hypothetical protein